MRLRLLFLFLTVFSIPLMAQNKVTFGIKAGINYSNVNTSSTLSNFPVKDLTSSKIGYHFGGLVNYEFNDKFSLQTEPTYSRQGYRSNDGTVTDTTGEVAFVDFLYHLDYLNVPIIGSFEAVKGLSLQAGPQFGFNLGSKSDLIVKSGAVPDESNLVGKGPKGATVEIGLLAGLQYVFTNNLFVQVRYVLGLTGIAPNGKGFKNRNAQLSVGYKFN